MKSTKNTLLQDIVDFKSENTNKFLHKILHYLRDVIDCDAGTIYLADEKFLRFSIFQNDSLPLDKIYELYDRFEDMKFEIEENSKTISVEAIVLSKMILVNDVYSEKKYDFEKVKEFDKQYNYHTKSILTIPIKNFDTDKTIGVIQLINKKDSDGNFIPFSNKEKKLIEVINGLIGLSISLKIKNDNLLKKIYKLYKTSNKDNLTNLYNRNYFQEVVMTLISLSHRNQESLSIIICDIDFFKKINDTYGHIAGDKVLKNVAEIFQYNLRKSDITIRYGGEEFLVILPNTNKESAEIVANILKEKIKNKTIMFEDKKIDITASFGISELKENEYDIDEVIKRADSALYDAKKQGRNKVIVYENQ